LLLLMSLFGTTMTAFALVGSTGRAYTLGVGVYGLLASASGIVHSLVFLVIGVPAMASWDGGMGTAHRSSSSASVCRVGAIGWLLFPILVGWWFRICCWASWPRGPW
jgi:solute:Na+ symporter, SSS family